MGDVICSECGNVAPPKATICPICGNRIERVVSPKSAGPQPGHAGTGSDPFAVRTLAVDLAVTSDLGQRTIRLQSGDRLQIGREVGPLTDLCTDNVSGDHAEINVGAGCIEIRDTGRDRRGSTNGTYVDGERIQPSVAVQLQDGAVISCGSDPPLTIRVTLT
jgi:ribosomal protein L40E